MEKFLLLAVLPAAVLGQCLSADDQAPPQPGERTNLYQGEQQFSIELLNIINKEAPTENIFFSPFSIYNALILAYFTAGSHTEQALKKVLHIPDSQDKVSTMRAYSLENLFHNMRSTNVSSDYELLSANRLFVSNKLNIRDCMKQLFLNEIVPLDFIADSAGAVKTINEWVANQTKNNIKDLLRADQISQATNLVLANAAYFKGLWKNRFPPENTRKEVFYISASESTLVPMMKQKGQFNHLVSEKIGAHILEIPYKGDAISIIFLLPPFTSPSGITNILERMKNTNFHDLTEELILRQAEIMIPKFDIEAETKLLGPLKTLGIGELFEKNSDLSSLTGVNEIKLDDVVHKAKVSLDEEGTTAAAATAIFNFRSSRPLDPVSFVANHPFVYVIYDKVWQKVLFTGVFNRPPPA